MVEKPIWGRGGDGVLSGAYSIAVRSVSAPSHDRLGELGWPCEAEQWTDQPYYREAEVPPAAAGWYDRHRELESSLQLVN